MRLIRRAIGYGIVMVPLFLTACTSHIEKSPVIKASLVEKNYDEALGMIESISQRSSRLLYLYEKGLVLHYKNNFDESNAAFNEAEQLYDALYTKSLSLEIASLITSDNVIKYRGELYEATLIHYYKILNFLYLDDRDGALVEARKLNQRLQVFADAGDSTYVDDPFLQYLTGMVYFSFGEVNDADVSFRNALAGYDRLQYRYAVETPEHLYCDLARSAESMHDFAAAASYGDAGCPAAYSDTTGVVNLFLEAGYVPHKVEENLVIPLYRDELTDDLDNKAYTKKLCARYDAPRDYKRKVDYILRVAMPNLVAEPPPFWDAEIRVVVDGEPRRADAIMVENLEALAVYAFERDRPQILFKTVLRGVTKYLAKKGLDNDGKKTAGWIMNAFNVGTERADTRSWTTLPHSIRMSRLALPEGVYDIEVNLFDDFGAATETFTIPAVHVVRGRQTFLNYRVH